MHVVYLMLNILYIVCQLNLPTKQTTILNAN